MRFPRLPASADIYKAALLTRESAIGVSSFLVQQQQADAIVRFSSLRKHSNVCELGAGFGRLSESILRTGVKNLLSVEWNRLCLRHLLRIQKLHSNYNVKSGDPYFVNYTTEFREELQTDPLAIFVNFPNPPRNYWYILQLLEDLVQKKQAFHCPSDVSTTVSKVSVVALLMEKKARKLCNDPSVPGNMADHLLQNYFYIEMGPRIDKGAFIPEAQSDNVIATKFIPLPKPVIDMDFENLNYICHQLSGGDNIFSMKGNRLIKDVLALAFDLDNNEVISLCGDTGLDADKSMLYLTFDDFEKLIYLIHRNSATGMND